MTSEITIYVDEDNNEVLIDTNDFFLAAGIRVVLPDIETVEGALIKSKHLRGEKFRMCFRFFADDPSQVYEWLQKVEGAYPFYIAQEKLDQIYRDIFKIKYHPFVNIPKVPEGL